MSFMLKEPKTFDEQVDILKKRNLQIDDEKSAITFFQRNNYYRVSAYYRPFYRIEDRMISDIFLPGTRLDDVKDLYYFDSELRRIIVPLLEKIEVSFRTQLAYYFAHNKGTLGHLKETNFNYREDHKKFIKMIDEVTENPKEKFLQHYKENYGDQYPIWVIIECISFGGLSKFYSNMTTESKKDICSVFYNDRHQKQIKNWMQGMTIIRNICAHHGRLFNREIYMPDLDEISCNCVGGSEKRMYSWLLIIKQLTEDKNVWNHFVYELVFVIDKYKFTKFKAMGFPEDWENCLVDNPRELKRIHTKLKIRKIYDRVILKAISVF